MFSFTTEPQELEEVEKNEQSFNDYEYEYTTSQFPTITPALDQKSALGYEFD